ncbi:S1C family serine protease [Paenibacillus ginsengarvi]|uniref:PDZ domain-containing protein n=1 Tax=Paenibacillus ginsengarvi TaxID=400777 RepID=A0A3B0BNX9_9BACL|nr:trypsin-like peptidase domain-containing protein [Paenibacillus ginsengarvi]RKN74214.1 PDZ domain-containing protein [Paenibacillus ginsengarvi]
MENNKRDYSDFFKPQNGEPNGGNENDMNKQTDQTEKPSYYYSYGPFKSAAHGEPDTTTASSADGTSQVEITTPRPVRPYFGYDKGDTQGAQPVSAPQWDYSGAKKKPNSFKSYFAAFLAGAVVVGSLMFVSDKYDMFGGAGAAAPSSSAIAGSVTKANGGGGNGGATTAALESIVRPDNISQIVNNSSPAVVKINTYVKASSRSRSGGGSSDIFDYFFGNGQRQQQPNTNNGSANQRQSLGMGSGFVFDKEGYILTNEHVVNGAEEIEVEVQGYSQPLKAKLLGSEYSLDLAVLKIEKQDGKDFAALQMGSSDDINVGDWVVAIGNPYGFDHTVTVGVLSAKERPIDIPDEQGTREYKHLLQTDASINPGNSGGPLLNLQGQVIGINTAVSAQAQGIGFAIPTSTVMSVLENLKNNVKVPIPYIGVNIQDIPEEWVKELKLDSKDGTIVASVVQGSPASKADIQPYDVITEVNGEKVKTSDEFRTKIKAMKVNDKVTLTVKRSGKTLTTGVIIGDMNK